MADEQYLSTEEIEKFLSALDKNRDGRISYSEVEHNVDEAYRRLRPHGSAKHGAFAKQATDDKEKAEKEEVAKMRRHDFVRSMMGTDANSIPIDQMRDTIRSWKIPSLDQEKKTEQDEETYMSKVPLWRRVLALWKVHGPEYVFMTVVVALQLGLGIWQCLKYALGQEFQAAFGWGVALAKFSAGALYPTLFFLLLSMSRWWSTAMRRFYYISRFINWDHSQAFHILMSIEALCLATLHAIGHLSGTFQFGSRANRQAAVGALLGSDAVPRAYVDYVRSLPGWSGLTALGILYTISLMSMPVIRKWSYEVFQAAHLLMFPFIGLIMAHGGLRLLQFPILGILLSFPTALIIAERANRLIKGFRPLPATIEVLDDDTVALTCQIPETHIWPYEAGQFVFLQVPQLSFFQWHPFTISTCIDREMQLHIKTDGDWTERLRGLAGSKSIMIGIDGPFGAPAQRFYDFDQAIVVGAGIGITPFSGILADLKTREDHRWSPSYSGRRGPLRRSSTNSSSRSSSRNRSSTQNTTTADRARARLAEKLAKRAEPSSVGEAETDQSAITTSSFKEEQTRGRTTHPSQEKDKTALSRHPSILPNQARLDLELYRRVDMHWIVRDKNYLLWFSDLLNRICLDDSNHDHLDIKLYNHVTRKEDDLSMHIYRCLLERHRTEQEPRSLLTGLVAPTHFGRPDLSAILSTHYKEMQDLFARDATRRRRVGVFFCGAPIIGEQLADLCRELTLRGAQDGSRIVYHFQIEVFG